VKLICTEGRCTGGLLLIQLPLVLQKGCEHLP
jgi:hypothetical protein